MAVLEVDVDMYIDEASTRALKEEVGRRIARNEWPINMDIEAEPWTPAGLAADIRQAFYARDASRLEALLMILERHSGEA